MSRTIYRAKDGLRCYARFVPKALARTANVLDWVEVDVMQPGGGSIYLRERHGDQSPSVLTYASGEFDFAEDGFGGVLSRLRADDDLKELLVRYKLRKDNVGLGSNIGALWLPAKTRREIRPQTAFPDAIALF